MNIRRTDKYSPQIAIVKAGNTAFLIHDIKYYSDKRMQKRKVEPNFGNFERKGI